MPLVTRQSYSRIFYEMKMYLVTSLFFLFAYAGRGQEGEVEIEVDLNSSKSVESMSEVFLAAVGQNGMSYHLDKIIPIFERENAIDIKPTFYPKIAIKLNTQFAPGICTSLNLVRELLIWLTQKGYSKDKIILFDRDRDGLVAAGFLSEKKDDHFFEGVRVTDSSKEDYYQSNWFHESPLPPSSVDRAKFILNFPNDQKLRLREERKSYLPAKILGDAFWINLAVPMDDPYLGIDGASANMTLGAMSNYGRFSNKTTLSAATVAEVMAIPEIWDKKLFSIIDFSSFQVANGQRYDSYYAGSQNAIFIGRNPFALDYLAWKIINKERVLRHGLSVRDINNALIFKYSEELGMGKRVNFRAKRIR